MNILKKYFHWTAQLSKFQISVLVLLLLILGSIWLIYIKHP